jgi:hypothetical protein
MQEASVIGLGVATLYNIKSRTLERISDPKDNATCDDSLFSKSYWSAPSLQMTEELGKIKVYIIRIVTTMALGALQTYIGLSR